VFDKKRKREGKEEEKKRLKKSPHLFLISSLSLPYLFLISSPSSPSFIIGKKRIFEQH
jgi:hypothetical protein